MWRTNDPHDVLASLEWAVNNAVVKQLGNRYLLFHAGAVARNGSGILLPAIAGSGKTTLVAGLISGGAFDYFSDEVGVVDPSTQMLLPFAKSLSVKDGSRAVLSPMYPWLDDTLSGRRFGGRHVWHLRPPDRTAGRSRVPVRYVVFPHYRADALTRLDPVSRSTALARLMEQSFSLREHGADGMRALVRVLGQAECYTLTIGALDQAIELMYRLTGEVCDE
ncbi:MAG: hypothetical protein JO057_28300 [Chloroflexi bacterium]|nr:hypothetical protein [Chloroflexota bacterium]